MTGRDSDLVKALGQTSQVPLSLGQKGKPPHSVTSAHPTDRASRLQAFVLGELRGS